MINHIGGKNCLEESWSWMLDPRPERKNLNSDVRRIALLVVGTARYISSILTANADWNMKQ